MRRKQIIALALMSVMAVSSMTVLSSCGDSAKKKDVKAKAETTRSKEEAKVPELTDVKTAAIEAVKSTDLSKLTDEEKASVEKLIADYEAKINEAKDADAVEKLHTEYAAELKKLVGEKAKEDETKAAAASETAVAFSAGTAIASSGGSSEPSSSGSSSGPASSSGGSSPNSPSSPKTPLEIMKENLAKNPCYYGHRCEYAEGTPAVYETREVWDDHKSVEAFITCVFAPGSRTGVTCIGPDNIPPGAIVEEYNDGGRRVGVYDSGLMAWIEERKAVYRNRPEFAEGLVCQWWQDDRWVGGYVTTEVEVSPATKGYYYCPVCGEKLLDASA